MIHLAIVAEIERGARTRGRDNVPARSTVADVIERGEAAGDVVGRVERRRGRGNEPYALGYRRQGRQ